MESIPARPANEVTSDARGEAWPQRACGYDYSEQQVAHALVSAGFQSELEVGTFDAAAGALVVRRAIDHVLGETIWQLRCRPIGEKPYQEWRLYCYTKKKAVCAECINVGTQHEDDSWLFQHVKDGGGADVPVPDAGSMVYTALMSRPDILELRQTQNPVHLLLQPTVPGLFEGTAVNVVCRELVISGRRRLAPFSYPVIGGHRFVLVDLATLREMPSEPERFPKHPKLREHDAESTTTSLVETDDRSFAHIYDGIRYGAAHFMLSRHLPGLLALFARRNIEHALRIERADPTRPPPVLPAVDSEDFVPGEAELEELRRTMDHLVVLAWHEDGSHLEAHLDGPDPTSARVAVVRARLIEPH